MSVPVSPLRLHVMVAGPFPPPVHGFSYITQEMAKILAGSYEVEIIDLAPHTARGGIFYHLRRIGLAVKGAWKLLLRCHLPHRALYVACEGNLGLIYTIKLAATARVLRYPVFIHHHSFGYIEAHSRLMAWLLKAAGRKATHIFLCGDMARHFTERYRASFRSAVLPNSAFVEPVPLPPAPAARPLTIGLLSNLTYEKGLGLFLDVLREAKAQKMEVAGVLAGPVQSDAERDAVTAAGKQLGPMLNYLGPVYGEAKNDFFRAIDVFVFPTLYANEAQPTVIFEALARGVPVLSYDRGCICSQVQSHGAALERNGDFIPFAIEWLKFRLSAPATLARERLDAQAAFVEEHTTARQYAAKILDTAKDE